MSTAQEQEDRRKIIAALEAISIHLEIMNETLAMIVAKLDGEWTINLNSDH